MQNETFKSYYKEIELIYLKDFKIELAMPINVEKKQKGMNILMSGQ